MKKYLIFDPNLFGPPSPSKSITVAPQSVVCHAGGAIYWCGRLSGR